MNTTSHCGPVFTDLRWPTDTELVAQDAGGAEFFATAVWRDDYQTYAVLVDGSDQWIGDQYGQYPTIAGLCWGLGQEGLEVADNSIDSLYGLAAITESTLGETWLVGIETDREAVLAIVHPNRSSSRLDAGHITGARWDPLDDDLFLTGADKSPKDTYVPFGWTGDNPEGLVATAQAAYGASVGHIGGAWNREAQALIGRGFVDLPTEFAVPVNSLHRDHQPVQVLTDVPVIAVLSNEIAARDLEPVIASPSRNPAGLSR